MISWPLTANARASTSILGSGTLSIPQACRLDLGSAVRRTKLSDMHMGDWTHNLRITNAAR